MNTEQLKDWCEQKLSDGVDCFTLSAVGMDRIKLLDRIEILDPSPGQAPDVVERLELRAGQHTNDHGGRHCFEIEATAGGEDHGLQTFIVHAELEGFTEPANAGGLVSQMMRHTEASFRLGTGTALTMQDKAQKMIDRQSDRIEYLESQRLEVLETMETVFINKHGRDMEAAKALGSEERKKLAATKLLELAPAFASTIAGKILPANKMDAITAHAARDLFEGIDQAQLQGMVQALPQEKQIQLFQLMKRLAQVSEDAPSDNAQPTQADKEDHH